MSRAARMEVIGGATLYLGDCLEVMRSLADGTADARMCGNSVCPPLARAIVAANYRDISFERKVA